MRLANGYDCHAVSQSPVPTFQTASPCTYISVKDAPPRVAPRCPSLRDDLDSSVQEDFDQLQWTGARPLQAARSCTVVFWSKLEDIIPPALKLLRLPPIYCCITCMPCRHDCRLSAAHPLPIYIPFILSHTMHLLSMCYTFVLIFCCVICNN